LPARLGIPGIKRIISTLEKVQKRAVNMINGLRQESYEGKLKELGLQSLKERREEAYLDHTVQTITQKSDNQKL
jgi:hypothetical protein